MNPPQPPVDKTELCVDTRHSDTILPPFQTVSLVLLWPLFILLLETDVFWTFTESMTVVSAKLKAKPVIKLPSASRFYLKLSLFTFHRVKLIICLNS